MDDKLARLPRWARDEITNLRRRNSSLEKLVNTPIIGAEHPDTSLHLRPRGNVAGDYLPSEFSDGRFMLGGHWNDFVDFRLEPADRAGPRRVYVHSGTSGLRVLPRSGNAFQIELSDH